MSLPFLIFFPQIIIYMIYVLCDPKVSFFFYLMALEVHCSIDFQIYCCEKFARHYEGGVVLLRISIYYIMVQV